MELTTFLLFFIIPVIFGQFSINSTRKRINEESGTGTWHTITLPLDHFNVFDNRTFQARYITNDQFYKKGGPLVVYIGGEWSIEPYGVLGGVAFQIAKKHNGFLFYPEHRYFGESLPFAKPVSNENLRFITPDFALADLAYSITHLKETIEGLKNSQVVVVGGSYAGALAIWGRMKYPHIIDIAYSCGGVIKAETFNPSYHDVSYRSLKQVSPECAKIIKSGVQKAINLSRTKRGINKLNKLFPYFICENLHSPFSMAQRIQSGFNAQVWPIPKSHVVCNYLLTKTKGSSLERLSQTIPIFLDMTDRDDVCTLIDREWFFLVCTFLGNLQTTHETNHRNLFTEEDAVQRRCINYFGSTFTKDFVEEHTRRTRILYGRSDVGVTNLLSVQGTHDPWFPNGILDDLNEATPVVYIEDANHCLELGEEQDDETPQVVEAKYEILKMLEKWIK